MEISQLVNSNLPLVTDYNDKYEDAAIEEVLRNIESDPVAMYELAYRYRCGEGGVEQNLLKSYDLYMNVLKYQKNICAMYRLGFMCLYDDIGENKGKEGYDFFYAAYSLGDADSAVQLGILYLDGNYVEEDYDKALDFFRFAVENGREDAYLYMGDAYRGKSQFDKAVYCYQKSSDAGDMEAAYNLGKIYGFGINGVIDQNVELAFEYLDKATEQYSEDVWYTKGIILLNENRVPEARELLIKAAEAGNENAQNVLKDIGTSNRTLQERAEEDHDPGAMIQYAIEIVRDIEKGGIHRSVELIREAHSMYPDILDVTEHYVRILSFYGHTCREIGDYDGCYNTYRDVIPAIDDLKRINYKPDEIRALEIDACKEYGEMAYRHHEDQLVFSMLARTDKIKYPHVSTMLIVIYLNYGTQYAKEMAEEVSNIKRALDMNSLKEDFEKASAYCALSLVYATGRGSVIKADPAYAYECIKKCAEIEYDLAKLELPKYSKGLFGKITYKP